MADDDEIDVLGDSNLNTFLSKNDGISYEESSLISQTSDLLNCEYTIHPQWLLDRPSANPDNWYNSENSEITEKNQLEIDTLGHLSTENCITDESGWTEKEKNLLERGIEIFGKSHIRLSQFIGSKTSSEVRYYLKNFYLENYPKINTALPVNTSTDVLDETQIPASIEEVIAVVSTGKPTVSRNSQMSRKKSSSSGSESFNDYNVNEISNLVKTTEKNIKRNNKIRIRKIKRDPDRLGKVKFKSLINQQKVKKHEQEINLPMKKEITTGRGLSVPIYDGEEIVKLERVEDDDINIEVDVDLSDDDFENEKSPLRKQVDKLNVQISYSQPTDSNILNEKNDAVKSEPKDLIDLSKLDEETFRQINSFESPKCEMVLASNHITQLEKVINWDFFDGKSPKTPQRYLRIRTHVINSWLAQKPKYLYKTCSRRGLKSCGDVNDITRIHQYLEQIGVINFGCEQVSYIRPLSEIIYSQSLPKERPAKEAKIVTRQVGELGVRQRVKKKFINDGEGGCTLTHDEKGAVIHTTVVNEDPPIMPKQKMYLKKPSIRLIYCRPFTDEKPQPYCIKINLSTILTMDFHAHLSVTEVMGLVAGYWIPQNSSMIITHYEPCLNIASSMTHCDMCPISQAKATDIIHERGLDILGWFHTHPTFAPEPSQQDLDTQKTVQRWIGNNKPCLGVILSPFNSSGALIASPYRCLIVDKKMNFEDQLVPYKFDVDIVADDFDIKTFLKDLKKVQKSHMGAGHSNKIDFTKPYFLDASMTHLEKFITSVRMYLAKCGSFNNMTCDSIIQGITDLFIHK